MPTQATVLYDGSCAFCRKSVSLLMPLDWLGVFAFRDARDEGNWPADAREPLSHDRLMEEMHVVTPDGRVFAGFRAFRWIAGRMPGLWLVVPLMYLPGAAFVGQKAYLKIAASRYKLVPCKDGVCELPPRPAKAKAGAEAGSA